MAQANIDDKATLLFWLILRIILWALQKLVGPSLFLYGSLRVEALKTLNLRQLENEFNLLAKNKSRQLK
jgi:hypothetical protein